MAIMTSSRQSSESPPSAFIGVQTSDADQNPTHTLSSPSDSSDENSGNTRFTFTPRRVKNAPRAWERKPSTPFAPRNETQKIWKRVPLQNLDMNQRCKSGKPNHQNERSMRTVKRLRKSVAGNPGDKENAQFVGTKWDACSLFPASPKRSMPVVASAYLCHDFVQCESNVMEMLEFEQENTTLKLPTCLELHQDDGTESDDEPYMLLDPAILSPSKEISGNHASEMLEDEHSRDEITEDIAPDVSIIIRSNISPESGPNVEAGQNAGQEDLDNSYGPAFLGDETEVFHSHQALPNFDTQIHVSSPTSQNGNTQHLDAVAQNRETDQSPSHEFEQDIVGEPHRAENCSGEEVSKLVYLQPQDNDDAAFLHEFLTRARAQKAARVQVGTDGGIQNPDQASPTQHQSTNDIDCSPPNANLANFALDFDDAESCAVERESDDQSEVKLSSPCRRSTRNTRLPRPQRPATSLPSNISLKRLNGTEFIALQRVSQALAIATRTNTRKNKGDAIPAFMKLVELKTGSISEISEGNRKKRKNCKEVTWAEKLARFHGEDNEEITINNSLIEEIEKKSADVTGVQEEVKQTRKVKRMRKENVGSVNGTPAPKRTISLLISGIPCEAQVEKAEEIPTRKMRTRSKD